MKVLTRHRCEVDRRTIATGIPGAVLMENAGRSVTEFLAERFAPLDAQRILIFCGKGNNGGDGMWWRACCSPGTGPSRSTWCWWIARTNEGGSGGELPQTHGQRLSVLREAPAEMAGVTIVVDALLGTGLNGPAAGEMLEAIRRINTGFPDAEIVAVDIRPDWRAIPSTDGESVRADYTVTFTARKSAWCCRRTASRWVSCSCAPSAARRSCSKMTTAFFCRWWSPRNSPTCSAPRPRMATKAVSGTCW